MDLPSRLSPGRRAPAAPVTPGAVGALGAAAFAAGMLARPDLTLEAARQGAILWWNNVLPALLPFFVGGQLLLGLGVGSFLGVFLEPALRRFLALPGSAGLVVAMAAGSGYPFGAVLTASLYRDRRLTRPEAERLLAVAGTANPLFTGGTVASAMLGNPGLAGLLLSAHYLAALATGLLLRLLPDRGAGTDRTAGEAVPGAAAGADGRGRGAREAPAAPGPLLGAAWRALAAHRGRDGRGGPEILAEAVENSVRTLLLVGGFIILGAVLLRLLDAVGLMAAATALLSPVLAAVGLPPAVSAGLLAGFLEITNGAQLLAAAPAPPLPRLVAVSAVLGWGGLSVLAQVAAVTRGTGLGLGPFVTARAIHAALAALLTLVLYDPARHALPAWLGPTGVRFGPAGTWLAPAGEAALAAGGAGPWLAVLAASAHLFALTVAGLAAAALLAPAVPRRPPTAARCDRRPRPGPRPRPPGPPRGAGAGPAPPAPPGPRRGTG